MELIMPPLPLPVQIWHFIHPIIRTIPQRPIMAQIIPIIIWKHNTQLDASKQETGKKKLGYISQKHLHFKVTHNKITFMPQKFENQSQ